MSLSSSQRKSELLGMPFGTATHHLRKAIMLRLLQRLGEDICFACGQKIETPAELSIEHKQPWENRDPALFWDLDNIAFSHLQCNVPHDRKHIAPPPGMSWCSKCRRFLPVENFYPRSSGTRGRRNGLRWRCKDCGREDRRLWRQKRREAKRQGN